MKQLKVILLSLALIMTSAVIGSSITGDKSFSAQAQQTTVKRKRKRGIIRKTYRGGRYVVRRTWDGTKWVSKKVWVGTKWTGRKSWRTGRKVVSRSKKIIY